MRLLRRLAELACACALALAVSPARAAPTPIYRCPLPDASVLYTDVPCRGGSEVALNAGSADPTAIARLSEMQRESSERYARERAAAARDAELRVLQWQSPASPYPVSPAATDQYEYWPGLTYAAPAHPMRRPHRPPTPRRPSTVVPAR